MEDYFMSKKLLSGLSIIIVLLIPILIYQLWYVPNYTGDDYYTYIGKSYKEVIEKDDSGNELPTYYYNQDSFNRNGTKKLLKFDSAIGRPIKPNNYIKISYNDHRKRVLSWEKVKKNQVPRKTLDRLINNATN